MSSQEQFNTYSKREAQNEASKMQEKIKQGKAENYPEAERAVEQSEKEERQEMEKLAEEAQDGTIADKIRSLDLSQEEGRNELRYLISPWYGKHQDIMPQKGKIYNADGTKLFPNDFAEFSLGYCSGGLLNLENFIKQLDFSSNSRKSFEVNGHDIVKTPYHFSSIFKDENKKNIDKDLADDPIVTIEKMGLAVGETLNNSYIGTVLMRFSGDSQLKDHPNWDVIKELVDRHRKYFQVFNETIFKALSNRIQDGNYEFPTGFEDIGVVPRQDANKMLEKREWTDYPEKDQFDVKLDEKARKYIIKIEKYTKALEKYNSQIPYAKPNV